MMLLEVASLGEEPIRPDVTGDEFVPLMVRWPLESFVIWHAVTPDGRLAGDVMVSSATGRIVGLTVLNSLSFAAQDRPIDSAPVEAGRPVVSLEPFDPNPDRWPQRRVVECTCSPTSQRDDSWLSISFVESDVHRWMGTSEVGFGVDRRTRLVSVRIATSAIPASSPLAATSSVGDNSDSARTADDLTEGSFG